MAESFTRTSRSRQATALMAWCGLVFTAFCLWDARQAGTMRLAAPAHVAVFLSTFCAFVAVFAWMLFNPARRSAVESPTLFFAAAATLFPPPIIGFCLLGTDSPLRGWLALALFLICVIAVLSHVPDDLIRVPRGRDSYLVPIPAFDGMHDDALDPNAAWFRFTDLADVVSDLQRPSLASSAWLHRENDRTRQSSRVELKPVNGVDDILGLDTDIGLLEDPLWDSVADAEAEETVASEPQPDSVVPQSHSGPAATPDGRTDFVDRADSTESPIPERPGATALSPAAATAEVQRAVVPEPYAPGNEAPGEETLRSDDPSVDPAHIARSTDVSGSELVEGVLDVHFDRGQKRANLHVPFSPPLSGTPEVECECVGEETLRLKVALRQPYGIRIEARRSNAVEELETQVGFAAIFSSVQESDAA